MQPDSVRALDLDRIRAVVGTTTYDRGLVYLRENAVESIGWNDTADILTGAVSGTAREPYTCTISGAAARPVQQRSRVASARVPCG
ncbi:hypothetical protein ACETU7_10695 [Rhodococcus sp. 3Y1]